jgi:hypothetical protein
MIRRPIVLATASRTTRRLESCCARLRECCCSDSISVLTARRSPSNTLRIDCTSIRYTSILLLDHPPPPPTSLVHHNHTLYHTLPFPFHHPFSILFLCLFSRSLTPMSCSSLSLARILECKSANFELCCISQLVIVGSVYVLKFNRTKDTVSNCIPFCF